MNKRVLKTLEYDKIIKLLSARASTDEGVKLCEKLVPMTDEQDIERALDQTGDAFSRSMREGQLGFSGVRDLPPVFRGLKVGASLSPRELLDVSAVLSAAKKAKDYDALTAPEEGKDSLYGYFSVLDEGKDMNREIRRCIISADQISDDASPTLRDLRRKEAGIDEKIRNQLNAILNRTSNATYLQDRVIAMRGDHYCVPVKAEYRGKIPGVVQDTSSTGSTVFIEPSEVVNLNNERARLLAEQAKEIDIILANLSSMVAEGMDIVRADHDSVVFLDFVFAKARLAEEMKASRPEFSADGPIVLKKARHPLLDPEKAVPINLSLGDTFDQLVVTGPNTGGKTVSLKTVGLLNLMGQAGLHIPAADNSHLRVFTEIFGDIGDEQSIELSLSTFSAHMKNIVYIMKHVDDRSLVLFDELCAGTDPTEGAALAISILKNLKERGVLAMATTHYSQLKVYALRTEGVENACCEFDVKTLSPTYRLLVGIPGKSNAFAISGKLGLGADIIDAAREELSAETESFEDLIGDLESRKVRMADEEKRIEERSRQAQSMRDKLDAQNRRNDEERDKILAKAREEAAEILRSAKEKADEAIRDINRYGSFTSQEKDAVKELEKSRRGLREEIDKAQSSGSKKKKEQRAVNGVDPKSLKIGDTVKSLSLNMKGTVHTLPDARGNLSVRMGILNYNVNVTDLIAIKEESEAEKYSSSKKRKAAGGSGRGSLMKAATVKTEVNLIGMTADDALAELDKYLDDAYLANLESVRVVHGKGSGVLRKAVQQHLKTLPYIKSYHQGEYGEGDAGVTIAVFDR
ncbi:MAG: endonuclease MutS2 [Eubacterium sp.]|nr:endonuclease MutS2 [Eubacterium sp.]